MLPLRGSLRHAWSVKDRATLFAVRGLVVATIACAVAAEWAARLVLTQRSDTYYALLIFLPLLVAPGALVWRWPRPKYVALWALAGWIETIVWSLFGLPHRSEQTLSSWPFVSTPVWITVMLVLFAAPAIAVLGVTKQRRRRRARLPEARIHH